MTQVRAKVTCGAKTPAPGVGAVEGGAVLGFYGVYEQSPGDHDENVRFNKSSPSLSINIQCDNPEAAKQFEIGKNYFVDFSLAES